MKRFLSWLLLLGNDSLAWIDIFLLSNDSIIENFENLCRMQQQQEVLAWLLEPLSQQWTQLEWQNNYLSEPLGLVRLCSETPVMWSVFHTITFFEKALKRSGTRKAHLNLQNNSTETATPLHPMASHLSWMLPPLPKVRMLLPKINCVKIPHSHFF